MLKKIFALFTQPTTNADDLVAPVTPIEETPDEPLPKPKNQRPKGNRALRRTIAKKKMQRASRRANRNK